MSGTGTFVSKRFLRGVNGDAINADHVVRIYLSPDGRLYANMTNGSDLELYTGAAVSGPLPAPLPPIELVSVG
jgi:hypothetical protein